jgi:hypothetical protein
MHETPATSAAYDTQGIPTTEANLPKDTSTPSNRPRENSFTLDIVSHNVNGATERLNADMTQTTTKLKAIAAYMKDAIDIFNHTNGPGEKVVDTMTRLNLQAATSYYQHKKDWTWHDHRSGRQQQLDHFLTDGRLRERIYDAKRLIGGAQSDHLPIKLRLRFGHKHSPRKRSRMKNLKVDWQKILEDQTTAGLFNRQATDNLHALKAANDTITSKALSKLIVKAAALIALPDKKKKTGWFAENSRAPIPEGSGSKKTLSKRAQQVIIPRGLPRDSPRTAEHKQLMTQTTSKACQNTS